MKYLSILKGDLSKIILKDVFGLQYKTKKNIIE